MPLHFQVYDDGSNAATAVQLTNTILAQKPQVVLGSSLTPATNAMVPFFKDGPVLYAFTPLLYPDKGSYVFATLPTHIEAGMLRYIRGRGWNKIAFLRINDASGQDNAKSIDLLLSRARQQVDRHHDEPVLQHGRFEHLRASHGHQEQRRAGRCSSRRPGPRSARFCAASAMPASTCRSSPAAPTSRRVSSSRFDQSCRKRGSGRLRRASSIAIGRRTSPLKPAVDEFYTTLEAAGLQAGRRSRVRLGRREDRRRRTARARAERDRGADPRLDRKPARLSRRARHLRLPQRRPARLGHRLDARRAVRPGVTQRRRHHERRGRRPAARQVVYTS